MEFSPKEWDFIGEVAFPIEVNLVEFIYTFDFDRLLKSGLFLGE